jgi:hypothetical protein
MQLKSSKQKILIESQQQLSESKIKIDHMSQIITNDKNEIERLASLKKIMENSLALLKKRDSDKI